MPTSFLPFDPRRFAMAALAEALDLDAPDRFTAALVDVTNMLRAERALAAAAIECTFIAVVDYVAWCRAQGDASSAVWREVQHACEPHTDAIGPGRAADALRSVLRPAFLVGYYGPDGTRLASPVA